MKEEEKEEGMYNEMHIGCFLLLLSMLKRHEAGRAFPAPALRCSEVSAL